MRTPARAPSALTALASTVLGAVLGAGLLAGLLAGCGGSGDGSGGDPEGSGEPTTLSRRLVEQEVSSQLGETVGREPEEVTCPGDLTAAVQEKMRCTLSDAGLDLGVTVTVTDVDGADATFDIQVDDAPR